MELGDCSQLESAESSLRRVLRDGQSDAPWTSSRISTFQGNLAKTIEKLRVGAAIIPQNASKASESDLDQVPVRPVLQSAIDFLVAKQKEITMGKRSTNQLVTSHRSTPAGDSSAGAPSKNEQTESKLLDDEKLKDIIVPVDSVGAGWDSIIGLDDVKQCLKEAVVFPRLYPQLFTGSRTPWSNILLYGPPGTGKTHLARALAAACQSTFFSITSSDLLSKWQGESEQMLKSVFVAARQTRPSIVFFDEVDAFCSSRSDSDSETGRRLKTEFLTQMQGIDEKQNDQVFILAATNLPWALDSAFLRRFDQRILVPLPDAQTREQLLWHFLKSSEHCVTKEQVETVAKGMANFSSSDIKQVFRAANMEPVREVLKELTKHGNLQQGASVPVPQLEYRHLHACIQSGRFRPTVTPQQLQQYKDYESR